jgi:two-component system sensor histidine kinase KdpD
MRPEDRPAPGDRRGVGQALGWWILVLAGATLALWRFRDDLDEAHATLAFLLIVLGASARNGRTVGLTLAVLSFLAFDFFLLPPYYTLHLENALDWSALLGFLLTGAVAAQLFHRAQGAQLTAERRAREAERLTAMAAESLAAPTAADAVGAITRVFRAEMPVRSVHLYAVDDAQGEPALVASTTEADAVDVDPTLMRSALREGRMMVLERNGSVYAAQPGAGLGSQLIGARSAAAALIPLHIRERAIGVLWIADPEGLAFDPAEAAFAEGLARHAALALERMRLAREAELLAGLREADRLKDAFVASVSHDLRTPLTTIRALAAEMREADGERAVIIEEEAMRLNRMVTDVLDLSRVRAGALPLDLQVIAAEDVVGAALQRLVGVQGSDRIQVRLPADGTLPVGRMDFVQALRALGNLLENALRHAPEQPVEVEVRIEGADLVFRVLDRGPGIAEADRERVFAPFQSGSSPASAIGAGTGLGLAIARSLADAQGGSLRYEARAGGGSVFVLSFPAESIPELE